MGRGVQPKQRVEPGGDHTDASADPDQRRFLTESQVRRLADTVPIEHRSLILVLAYSGIRWGEAVALRRGRCDLLRRRLHILESAVEVDGHLSWGLPKTHRQRAGSIPAFVCEDIAEHLVGMPDHPDELVFRASTGGPLRHGDFLPTSGAPR